MLLKLFYNLILDSFLMIYFVYILYSDSFNIHYIGQTDNLEDRLNRHNKGYERSTRPYIPWKLIWRTEKPDRGSALILERKLKNLNRSRLITFIIKYSDGTVGCDENG